MDFKFTEEQELLAASLIEFMDREFPESLMKECDENHRFPEEANRKFFEAGFGTIGIPEEYGGTPADMVTMCMVMEIVHRYGWRCVRYTPLAFTSMLEFGSEEQKAKYLPNLAKGIHRSAFGITEPGAGSDAAGIKTTYKKVEGGSILNGSKIYNTGASIAAYNNIVARDADVDDPHKAMSMFLVPMDTPGVRAVNLNKVGQWMEPTCETFLDNVFVPDSALYGKEHGAWIQLMKHFEAERLLCAAMYFGMAQTAYADAVAYANSREQFGQKIGNFQLIQEKITYMRIKIENMHNMLYKTAWKYDQGISIRTECNMAKLYACQSCWEIADDAMQILGGLGYTMDHRVQRIWRDARVGRIGAGSDQIMITTIAKNTLKEQASKGYVGGTRGLG